MVTAATRRSPTLKVGLIGCGRIAQLVHLPALTRLPDIDLAALAEPDADRRAEAGRRAPRATAVADYRDLLAMTAIDAVVICLPNALHAPAAIAAFEHGKHVYLEKPLALDLDEGQAVLAAWQRAGTVGQIGFNYRFHPLHQAARRHLRAGRIGELVGLRSVFSTAARPLPDWKQTRRSGGGVLLDQASHHIDLVRFLVAQEVRSVAATVRSQRVEADTATLHLTLDDGLIVQSFFSRTAVENDYVEIFGQAGKLTIDRYGDQTLLISEPSHRWQRLKRLRQQVRGYIRNPRALKRLLLPGYEPSYSAALRHFAEAVSAGRPVSPDLWDGYRSLAVIVAAEEAAATGQVVALPERAYENSAR